MAQMAASMQANRATVTAAVAASIAASVVATTVASAAASAAGSVVGGVASSSGGGGGAVPALLGAQRFAMYGSLAGGPGILAKACQPPETSLLLGRFGIAAGLFGGGVHADGGSGVPSRFAGEAPADDGAVAVADEACSEQAQRRRLARGRTADAGGDAGNASGVSTDASEMDELVDAHLFLLLSDTVATLFVVMLSALAIHALALFAYATCRNRGYYRALAQAKRIPTATALFQSHEQLQKPPGAPRYRGLPGTFVFPHLELLVLNVFVSGLIQASSTVYGTHAASYHLSRTLTLAAIVVFGAVLVFLAFQGRQILRFRRRFGSSMWAPAAAPASISDMDDPLLRLFARCRLLKPCMRVKGEYAIPEEATAEPGRTERAIQRALPCRVLPWKPRRDEQKTDAEEAAAQVEGLNVWLCNGCGGSLRGTCFDLGVLTLQMLLSTSIALFSVLSEESPTASTVSLGCACALQLCMAVWNVWGDAVDRVDSLVACVVSLLELGGTSLLLAMSVLNTLETGSVEVAAALGGWSGRLLMASVFVPIVQTLYDGLLVPLGASISSRLATGQPCWKALLGVSVQALLLPLIVVTSVFGLSLGGGTDLLQTVIDDEAAAVQDGAAAEAEEATTAAEQRGTRSELEVEVEGLGEQGGYSSSEEILALTV